MLLLTPNLSAVLCLFPFFNIVDAGDASNRLTSLLGGHFDATIVPYSGVKEYVENKDIKILCTLLGDRLDLVKEIPTAKEQGYEDLILNTMYVCLAPKGTDENVIKKINDTMIKIGNSFEYQKEVEKFNLQKPYILNVEDSIKELKEQSDRFMKFAGDLK